LSGRSQVSIASELDVTPATVCRWVAAYRAHGEDGIASTVAPGREPKLTDKQVATVRRLILGKNPRQLNFGPALWTLDLVGQVIQAKFQIVLHKTTVARYLHRFGVTPQKPVRRAFQRDDAECRTWMTSGFPAIVREAKRKQATLLFADETGVHEDHAVGTTWGERGKTPEVRVSGSRRRVNVISAISPRGRLWFRCYSGTLTATRYVEFVSDLLQDVRGKIILVHDRHPAHTAAAFRRFAATRASRLSVYELPSYAPDLNPDEHVWGYLKQTFRSDPMTTEDDLSQRVNSSMHAISADRDLVRKFFDHPEVRYVKDALKW
jgi:transposase